MKWFRFYHDAYRDPKVQDMRPELFKFWVNFLCVASASEERGVVESEGHLRRALGITKGVVKRYVDELEGIGVLHRGDGEALVVHNWESRQPDSDDAAKRKRAERERTCVNGQQEMSRDMSRDTSRDKNVTVTSRVREEEEETEIREEIPPTPKGERVSFVLPDWIPAAEWHAFMEMRAKIRKPMTDQAKVLAVRKLERLRAEGSDPAEVLSQSVLASWQGLFPLDRRQNATNNGPPSKPIEYFKAPADFIHPKHRKKSEP